MWLIAQGKEVYLNALKDPDSLSGVTLYGYCSFEALGYISSQVYSAMKGKNIYQDSTARMQMECYEQVIRDIVYHPMIEYPLELPEAMVVYPKLCECHLSEQVRKAPQESKDMECFPDGYPKDDGKRECCHKENAGTGTEYTGSDQTRP